MLIVFVTVVVTAAVTAVIQWLAANPRARRRVANRAAKGWMKLEHTAARGSAKLMERRRRLREKARGVALELWTAVEDLAFAHSGSQIPPVSRRLYAHGAWMGAAPALLEDMKWRKILAFLMPDVYRDVARALADSASHAVIIPMFENNPVMCAFGLRRAAKDGPVPCMEWDIFLSISLVDAWEEATTAQERGAAMVEMVDTMIIGHAAITDTVQEQLGVCQWSDVRKTPKARMGGVQTGSWLDLLARALLLSEAEDVTEAIQLMSAQPRRRSREACMKYTFAEELPAQEAVDIFRRIIGAPKLSVVLEVKSSASNPELLKALVGELNRRSVHVDSVGAFDVAGIKGVSEVVQQIDGRVLPGPREILFLHFAGDLQAACDRGGLVPGQAAMFNGASLLTARVEHGQYTYGLDHELIAELDGYRERHQLELGIYVQENDLDAAAAAILSELVASRPALLTLGFAWGGLADEVSLAAGQGDRRGFGSQALVRRMRVGKTWRKSNTAEAV